MANFNAILDKQVESAERPKPMPTGTYTFIVKSHTFDESSQKKTPFVRFMCSPMAPGEDVDPAALAEIENWNQKEMKLDFYLTDDAIYRLREFAEQCGIGISGRTFADIIPELTNTQFLGEVGHEISKKNPEEVYANIVNTAAAD